METSLKKNFVSHCISLTSLFSYAVFSILTVFINRQLFTSCFEYPVLVTWCQQILILIFFEFSNFSLKHYCFRPSVWRPLIPSALAFTGMIMFSNLCLQSSSVSSYQIARSTTIIFNMILSFWITNKKFSTSTILSCLLTGLGFFIGKLDPFLLSWKSCITGILSSLFQSLYSVALKSFYCNNRGEKQFQVLYGTAFISSICLLPFLLYSGDFFILVKLIPRDLESLKLLGYVLVSGLSGILVTISAALAVNLTSPVSYCIAGYGKAAVQSFGGILFFNERCSLHSMLGLVLTLVGCFMYSISVITSTV